MSLAIVRVPVTSVCLSVCLSACLSACAATVRYGDSSYYTRPSPASRFVTLTNTVSLQRGIDCLLQNIVRFGTSLRPKFRSLTKMYIAKGYAVSLHLLITKINSSLFHSNLPTSKYTLLQGHQKFRISNDRVLQRWRSRGINSPITVHCCTSLTFDPSTTSVATTFGNIHCVHSFTFEYQSIFDAQNPEKVCTFSTSSEECVNY